MRLCSSARSSFGSVVMMAKLRIRSLAGERQFSHRRRCVPSGEDPEAGRRDAPTALKVGDVD